MLLLSVLTWEEGQECYVTETIYDKETKLPVFQRTLLNGLKETPPDGSPSQIIFDAHGRPQKMSWHKQDKSHNEDGPAELTVNPDNGIHTVERYVIDGKPRHPSLGPHYIVRDRNTGVLRKQEFAELDSPEAPHL